MPRFFFHLCDSDLPVTDDEGVMLPDEEAALEHGTWCARQVIANDIMAGLPVRLSSYIVIAGGNGRELGRAYFRDVLELIVEPD